MKGNQMTGSKSAAEKGLLSAAAAAAAKAPSTASAADPHEAFRRVDALVAKPTYGSDGARAWQAFRTGGGGGTGDPQARTRTAASSKSSTAPLGSAPLAPLKKLDRLQFASWKDEVEHEKSIRQQEGQADLHSGYQLFHEKHKQPKKKKTEEEEFAATADGGAATTRKRDSRNDEPGAATTAASTDVSSKKKKKANKSKAAKGGLGVAVTMVDTPDHPLQQVAEAIRRRAEAFAGGGAAPGPNLAPATVLPAGWEAAVDASTQRTYYYNRATSQRQWTVPVDEAKEEGAAAIATTTSSLAAALAEDADLVKPSSSLSDLPPGWEAVTDPATKKRYYYHRETRETRWDRPGA